MDANNNTLRDLLAFDRTMLANERTLLAYIRTFIGMIASGAALLKLFDVSWAQTTAVTFLIMGPICLIVGLIRFARNNKRLKQYMNEEPLQHNVQRRKTVN